MTKLKAFRLPNSIIKRLRMFAKKTHRTETFYVLEALNNYFDQYEDVLIATDRFEDPKTKFISGKELRNRLGI